MVHEVEQRRIRAGVDPASLAFATGYADDAVGNYGIFARLKAEAAVPAAAKYQVCMANPLAIAYNFISPNASEDFVPAYTAHLRAEFARIADALPHGEIAYQWDVCPGVLMWDGYYGQEGDRRGQILDSLGTSATWCRTTSISDITCATATRRTSTWCSPRISGSAWK